MAQYTAEVFRWTGTYYNSQYNTSYTAVFDDNDGSYQGSGDSSETISIDGGSFAGTTGSPYAIDVSFTATDGQSHVETFYFFNTTGGWHFAPGPGSEFTVGATLGSYQSHTVGWDYTDVTCFVRGTMITTDAGPVPVEDLSEGQRVLTVDGRFAELRMLTSRTLEAYELALSDKLRPVRIEAGALGQGLPMRDLYVSRQHRMLVSSKIVARMFGQDEALIAAVKLTELPGIDVVEEVSEVEYFHLIFDQHETVFAEGAPSESLYLGAEAMKTMPDEALEEMRLLFPDLVAEAEAPEPSRYVPVGRAQKQLVARHAKNGKALLDGFTGGMPRAA